MMRVTIIGCSGSFPGPDSPASCYLVRAHDGERDWQIVLDLGNGALGALQRHIDPLTLDAVLLSHLHPDHCLDLTGLHVMRTHHPRGTPSGRLDIYAPDGAADRLARAHGVGGPSDVRDTYAFPQLVTDQAFTIGPFTITAYAVAHPVPAFGFRVQTGGLTLAYTGDTDSCDALKPLMTGADLVLADAAFIEGRDRASGVHLSGRRAAQAAVDAGGVRRLMLTHIPSWNDPQVCREQAEQIWPGTVELAQAGATIHLA
ncbi:MAG: MBL fold metallo-hydrolase [Ornithinimicrobium sp.]